MRGFDEDVKHHQPLFSWAGSRVCGVVVEGEGVLGGWMNEWEK